MPRPLATLLVPILLGAGLAALAEEDPALGANHLAFVPGSIERMVWDPIPGADFYGLYRGRLGPGELFEPGNHRCLATELAEPFAEDPLRPMPGTAFYYLATGLVQRPDPEEMDWGPLGTGAHPRAEGSLPCGRRIFFDPNASGAADGSSWADAYTTLADTNEHPSPNRRGLEVWMTAETEESVAIDRRDFVFYGGFRGDEGHAWERDPSRYRFLWAAPAGEDQLHGAHITDCVQTDVVLDGIRFEGGRRAVYFMLSGMTFDVSDTIFRGQDQEAFKIHPPTDYKCGTVFLCDRCRLEGHGPEPLLLFELEGGETYDIDLLRTDVVGEGGSLVRLSVGAGTIGSEGDFAMLGCELRGGQIGLDVLNSCLGYEAATMTLQLASNLLSGSSDDAVSIGVRPGFGGACRATGQLLHNTVTDVGGSGVACAFHEAGATAECSLTLTSNAITFAEGYGIAEPDHSAPNAEGDFVVIGNDLYGNGWAYLDDGVTPLHTIDQVNALPRCWANLSLDPLYVDRPGGDFHLLPGSPLIDAAAVSPPPWVLIDVDGESRSTPGSPEAPARADIGADEHRPPSRGP
jgi:hypothetical protein